MDLMETGEAGSGWTSFPEDCFNQECHSEEPLFGFMELVCVTVIYVPLMVFGLLGNVLTILVVWLRPHMRSSTYLYLSSMAVSDLLILLLLPLDLYKLWRPRPWPLGDLACKLTMFLSECCTFCTILHITFLSLERYLAICWPMVAKTLVTRHRTKALIGCLWIGAAVSAAPVLVMVGVEGLEEAGAEAGRSDNGECRCTDYAVSSGLLSAMMVLSNLYFLVPFCILGLVYGLIGRTLWLRPRSNRRDQSHRHTVKMLGVIVLAFVLCWLPFHVGRTIFTLSLGGGGGGQETHPDTSPPPDVSGGGGEGIDTQDVAEPVTRKLEIATRSHGGKTETHEDIGTGKHSADATHANTAQHPKIDLYKQALPHDDTLKNVPSDFDTNTWTHTSKLGCTDARTHVDTRNGEAVCVHSRTDRTQNHTRYALSPVALRNDTHLNDTHADDDAHMFFLYYLSQYLNLVSSVLFYLSAAINPLLYNLMSARYRHAVHGLVHARSHTPVHRLRTLTGQHSTTNF